MNNANFKLKRTYTPLLVQILLNSHQGTYPKVPATYLPAPL